MLLQFIYTTLEEITSVSIIMKALLTFLFLTVLCASAQVNLRPAKQALQVKQFGKAVGLLDEYLAAKDNGQKDYATYLRALALFHDKKGKAAVDACDQVL